MFNLDDILRQAQGGGAAQTLARQFGISPDQAQAAMEALTPAFQMGLQRQAQQDPRRWATCFRRWPPASMPTRMATPPRRAARRERTCCPRCSARKRDRARWRNRRPRCPACRRASSRPCCRSSLR
ncbi:MAG: DUF937 domain-containing protein [Rhodoblastus sp.]|nr:MAG: DUF937 domain-containing protein [Rhodoblastus sp.]